MSDTYYEPDDEREDDKQTLEEWREEKQQARFEELQERFTSEQMLQGEHRYSEEGDL